jgi:hypothetical protein
MRTELADSYGSTTLTSWPAKETAVNQHWKLVALVWVPFVSIFAFAAPALVERVGDSHPHIAFHIVAAGLLVWATLVALRLRRTTSPDARAARLLLGALLVSIPAAVLGNLLELLAAVGRLADDGWESRRTEDLFGDDGGLHFLASNLTIPALMLSMLLTLVVATGAAIQGRRLESVR